MKKQNTIRILWIFGTIWLLHTVYLLAVFREFTLLKAFVAGPSAVHILFRAILLLIGVSLVLRNSRNSTTEQLEDYIKLKKAVDISGEIIFITDRNGVFTYINPEFTNVYGFTADEILGKKTPRILKSETMNAENYQKFWQHILQKQVIKGDIINKTKSGKLINVESSANPILNSKNEIIGFLCIQRDITERKIREQKLQESEKTARAMLNASEHPVYLVDRAGEILSANESGMTLLRLTPDNLVGKNVKDFTFFRETDHLKKLDETIQSEQKNRFEETFQDRHYDVTIYPLFDVDGHLSRVAIINVDITDHKNARQTIKEQNQFLHSVIESLEHPLFVIDVNDYTVTLANSAATGPHALKNIPCYALTHGISEPCHATEHLCPLEEMKKTKKPVVTHHVHYDAQGRKRDVEVRAFPIFDTKGELRQMIEYTLDITDTRHHDKNVKVV